MPLRVLFDGDWDARNKAIKEEIEKALHACIGDPPAGQVWFVSLFLSESLHFCEVKVRTPSQSRMRLFFEEPRALPKIIVDWIALYPLA